MKPVASESVDMWGSGFLKLNGLGHLYRFKFDSFCVFSACSRIVNSDLRLTVYLSVK